MTRLQDMRTIARGGLIARKGLLVTVALAAISVARGVSAADTLSASDDVPRAVVGYTDLNLASPLDAKRLLRRIAGAAVRVCGDPSATLDLSARARKRGCVSTAIARAVETIASEKLTMAYVQSPYAPRRVQLSSPRAASIAATPGR